MELVIRTKTRDHSSVNTELVNKTQTKTKTKTSKQTIQN